MKGFIGLLFCCMVSSIMYCQPDGGDADSTGQMVKTIGDQPFSYNTNLENINIQLTHNYVSDSSVLNHTAVGLMVAEVYQGLMNTDFRSINVFIDIETVMSKKQLDEQLDKPFVAHIPNQEYGFLEKDGDVSRILRFAAIDTVKTYFELLFYEFEQVKNATLQEIDESARIVMKLMILPNAKQADDNVLTKLIQRQDDNISFKIRPRVEMSLPVGFLEKRVEQSSFWNELDITLDTILNPEYFELFENLNTKLERDPADKRHTVLLRYSNYDTQFLGVKDFETFSNRAKVILALIREKAKIKKVSFINSSNESEDFLNNGSSERYGGAPIEITYESRQKQGVQKESIVTGDLNILEQELLKMHTLKDYMGPFSNDEGTLIELNYGEDIDDQETTIKIEFSFL